MTIIRRRTAVRRILPCALAGLMYAAVTTACTTQLHAQSADLAAIDSLVAHSRFRDAAAALAKWERDNASRITPADRATALLLRARMTSDADSARNLYLDLSVGYPSSPEAAHALLRLGQHAHAASDMARARSYFQRIVTDYPHSPVHADAVTWLAKSQTGSTPARPAQTPPAQAATPQPAAPQNATPKTAATDNGAFALQIGAFREQTTATTVARQLTKQGFDARVVFVSGSTLARVRVGRFANSRAAGDELRRLRAAGHEAVVVDDARTESAAPAR